MEIWLISEGVRKGPYPDYAIREKIEGGLISAGEMVWHEGLPAWIPVGELELFKSTFEKLEHNLPIPPPTPISQSENGQQDKAKPKHFFMRRFWARWTDLSFYAALWWLLMYVSGRDIGAVIPNLWIMITMFLPWFLVEAWLIHRFGTTPGKWLMCLRVTNEDGSLLELKPALWRGFRVLVTGIGFGWGLLSLFCQAMSWFTTRKLGKPVWDFAGKHKVEAIYSLKPLRVAVLILVFLICAQLQMAVRGPHEQKLIIEQYPQYKEYFKNNAEWYFPVKK